MDSSKKLAKYKTLNSEDYALEIERELLRIIKNIERKIARDKHTATNEAALERKKGARVRVRKKAASKKKRTKK